MSKKALEKPLSLDHLTKVRNRVYRIGIELEGGWKTLPPGTNLARDGSVRFRDEDMLSGLRHMGEIPSPVLTVEQWPTWMKQFYPHFVNETCGLHVHLSFRSALTYSRLMAPTYPSTIIAYLTAWAKQENLSSAHPIWPRLAGKSEYCQHVFAADEQIKNVTKDYDHHRPGNRYSAINYCYCVNNTLECRVLPMLETVEQAIRAVANIIQTTNAFLVATARREERLKITHITDAEDVMQDEKRVIV